MGTSLEQAKRLDAAYVVPTFARKDVQFTRGQGARLYDDEGTAYLDFLAGIGVVSVGHCNPQVTAAIQAQAATLVHVGNYFHIETRGQLSQRICGMLAGGSGAAGDWRVFYANSGAEANEGAIKLARLWGSTHAGGAAGIITATRSFHGRTLASLAATGQPALHAGFEPLPAGFGFVPLNDVAALQAAIEGADVGGCKPVAVMLECIQGEAGVWPCTAEYLQAARRLTREHGMLLICDEVQTGFCRTGECFAYQGYGVQPDIVTMAKGIADGIPMGAFAATADIAALMGPGTHGSTFGGSNIACVAADATTRIMCEPGFLPHVREVGEHLRAQLAQLPFVTDVRGAGLMVGVSLAHPVAGKVVDAGLAHGFVLNAPAADVLRFLPPLIITDTEADALIAALPALYEEACDA